MANTPAPLSPRELNNRFTRAHVKEAKRLKAEFHNFGKGVTEDGVYSTTSEGGLETTILLAAPYTVTHRWF